jgi:hypothetical protein
MRGDGPGSNCLSRHQHGCALTMTTITLDVYSHAMPRDGAAAARVIGGAIYGAETGS